MKSKVSWHERAAEHRRAAIMDILQRPWPESELQAIKRVSSKYNGRTLPGGKHLHLSVPTLKRIWYRWKANPSESAFDYSYPSGQRDPMPVWQVKLLESFAIHHGLTLMGLHRHLQKHDPEFPFSKDAFYRHLPIETKLRIAKAVKLRKRQAALDLEKQKLTEDRYER